MHVSGTMTELLDRLTPTQKRWFVKKVFPWGFETPTLSIWIYIQTLLTNYDELQQSYEGLLRKFGAKAKESDLFKQESSRLKLQIDEADSIIDDVDYAFSLAMTKDQAWRILDRAIEAIHSMYMGKGAFSDWSPDPQVEFAILSKQDKAKYWEKMYAQSISKYQKLSMENVQLTGAKVRLQGELDKLTKELTQVKSFSALDPQNLVVNSAKLIEERSMLQHYLDKSESEVSKLKRELEKEKEATESMRDELAEQKQQDDTEIGELQSKNFDLETKLSEFTTIRKQR